MISYDGVILKRLRFKGEPDVPEISAAEIGLIGVEASERFVLSFILEWSPKIDS